MNLYEKNIKRVFDVVMASCGLLILSPLIAAIAMIIKKEDGGSVLYRGERVGKDGIPFRIHKFRTMVMNAEELGGSSTSDYDPRITKCGRILRKYKLDELPQLLNVLKGEMSFVGPRPEVEEYVQMYKEDEKRILTVRPGITDWASIWNPDEGAILSKYPDPDQAYLDIIRPKKLELQKKYVDEISFVNDMRILILTAKALRGNSSAVLEDMESGDSGT